MKILRTTLAISVLIAVAGCQSTAEEPREIASTNQETQQPNAFDVYEQSKANYESWLVTLKDAKSLKIYSPDLYAELLESWDEAVEIYEDIAVDPAKANESYSVFSSGTYADNFNQRLAIVEKNHAKLTELKVTADELLADSIAQMAYLDSIEAKAAYSSDYSSVVRSYRELFEYVEEGDLDDAQVEQVDFLNKAKKLEQKVVLKQHVLPLKNELKKLRSEGFNRVAAISYAKAKAEVNVAENTVKANTRDLKIIAEAVASAHFELDHVRNTAAEVKLLSSVDDEKFEPIVLEFEGKLLSISKAIDGADYRDQPLRVQTEMIVAGVKGLHSANSTDELESKIAGLNSQNEALKAQVAKQTEAIAQEQEKQASLTKQLTRTESHIASLEQLIANYKQQLQAKEGAPEVQDEANAAEAQSTEQEVAPASQVEASTPTEASDAVSSVDEAVTTTTEAVSEAATE